MRKRSIHHIKFTLTLCSWCAESFYRCPARKIRRLHRIQEQTNHCDLCRNSFGYDFLIEAPYRAVG